MTALLVSTQYDLIEIESMAFFRLTLLKKVSCFSICIYLLISFENVLPNGTKSRAKRSLLNVVPVVEQQTHHIHMRNIYEPFHFIIKPSELYSKRIPQVVSTVLTTAERFQHRQVIRETWANHNNSENIKNGNVKVYFLLSFPIGKNILDKLYEEQELYNDLIITNLTESYDNLYQKVFAAFLFVQTYFPLTSYHMKVDDDVLIEMDRLLHFLQNNKESSILCKVWAKSVPKRNRKHKWYVSKEQWSSTYYPKYCDGPMYLIAQKALKSILNFSQFKNFFPFEDVFFTGILPEAANVTRESWSHHILHYNTELWWKVSECDDNKMPLLFSIHSLNTPSKMRFGYDILRNLECISHHDLLLKRTAFYEKKKER